MSDVRGIFELIDAASRTSTVLPRTEGSICENLRDYVVTERAGQLIACAALHIWTVELAEIRSVVVAESMRGSGFGARIVGELAQQAADLGLARIFVLTDSEAFFSRQGFRETDRATLPHKVWNECILCPKFEDCGEIPMDRILNG